MADNPGLSVGSFSGPGWRYADTCVEIPVPVTLVVRPEEGVGYEHTMDRASRKRVQQCARCTLRVQTLTRGGVSAIAAEDRDFVQTLERGLAVLHAFGADHETLTLRETADAAGISRPAARRLLLTLEALGYLSSEGSSYRLTPQVLRLADAYLGSRAIAVARRHLESFSGDVGESASMSMLDDAEIVLVVRSPVNRMRTYLLGLGERMPAYATAQGRVLLSQPLE